MTTPCCDVFAAICGAFMWMHLDGEPDNGDRVLRMPHVPADGEKWRVNFCPNCGKCVTDIRLPQRMVEESRRLLEK